MQKPFNQFVMKKTISYYLITFLTIFASCSTSDDINSNDEGNGHPTSTSYWPFAIGNKWNFKNINDPNDSFVHHLYKTINYEGKTYFQVEFLNAPENTETTDGVREDNGVFYELHGAISQMGVNISAGTIMSINTNLSVGEEWTDYVTLTVSGDASGTITHTNKGKIIEKVASLTLNGKTYQNILKIELIKNINNSINGSSFTIKYEDWLAKGIGPVYRKTTYNYGENNEVEEYQLTSYSLN